MGVALLVGMALARLRHWGAHAWCQSAVVLSNLVVIAGSMAPAFHRRAAPEIPASLGESYYALAAAHAAIGILAEFLGVYILVVAGTNILPKGLRFTRFKLWMRAALALWWLALLLGLGTYFRWYVAPLWVK
jgi:uncharacterized membrane protein YozB (DUF420 family)